ncbi:MAG: nuclear transport factor 2 family protein, partial [Rhodospirillaceae bacterium]|nr:nuclear transport factor 2 family protein [Rhodospirillaceae bacterium]
PPVATPPAAPRASGTLADAYGTGKVRSFLDAVNNGDINAALGLFDPGATIEDPVGAQVQQGKAALDAYVRGLVARGTKYELALPVRGGGTQAAAAVRLRGGTGIQSVILVFTLSANGNIATLKAYAGAE